MGKPKTSRQGRGLDPTGVKNFLGLSAEPVEGRAVQREEQINIKRRVQTVREEFPDGRWGKLVGEIPLNVRGPKGEPLDRTLFVFNLLKKDGSVRNELVAKALYKIGNRQFATERFIEVKPGSLIYESFAPENEAHSKAKREAVRTETTNSKYSNDFENRNLKPGNLQNFFFHQLSEEILSQGHSRGSLPREVVETFFKKYDELFNETKKIGSEGLNAADAARLQLYLRLGLNEYLVEKGRYPRIDEMRDVVNASVNLRSKLESKVYNSAREALPGIAKQKIEEAVGSALSEYVKNNGRAPTTEKQIEEIVRKSISIARG